MRTKAILFDMNGVLINDEPFHKEAWRIFCSRRGMRFSEEEFKRFFMGRTNRESLQYLFQRDLSETEHHTLREERIGYSKSLLPSVLPAPDGLDTLLRDAQKKKVPCAIATSSQRDYAEFVIEKYGFGSSFQAVVTAEDVHRGKPDPEIYLLAAERVHMPPNGCLVFEDSMSGIQAAKAAGMKVVGITSTHGPMELAEADRVIADFTEISLAEILEM